VIRSEQTSASVAFGTSFRCRDIAGLGLFRARRISGSRLARGGERCGDEKVQRARTGRTGRAAGAVIGNDWVGSEAQDNLEFEIALLAPSEANLRQ
jgi:hypothetical protein